MTEQKTTLLKILWILRLNVAAVALSYEIL